MSEISSRPLFLTVLCLLTIMSSIAGLWTQSERLWNPGVMAEKTRDAFEIVQERMERQTTGANKETMDRMFESILTETNPESIQAGALIMLIFESLSLYAAYLMWNLNKRGFYLYVAGIIIAFLAPLLFIGGWLGLVTSFAGIFISIFMCILYALNLKHMS